MNLKKFNGKRVKFENDLSVYVGTNNTSDIIINIKKGSEFIIKWNNGLKFEEPDGWITFRYDEQWITFDASEVDSDKWEPGLSLLLSLVLI